MLSTLTLKRGKSNGELSEQEAVAIAPGAEESCPAPDSRPSRSDSSLRMEPRFTAGTAPEFTASDFAAERIVPQADAERHISRVDTERLTPRTDPMFSAAEFPSPANDAGPDHAPDFGPVEDQPSISLEREPSGFARAMKRAVTGLVIMLTGAVVTVGWKTFGDDAKQLAHGLTQQLPLVSWLHLKHQNPSQTAGAATAATADTSAQASPDSTQATDTPAAESSQQAATPAADQQATPQQAAASQPAPAAPAATETAATTAAVSSPDVTQLTQSVQALTHEVAALQKSMAEMKTNQEQMTREIAKLNERTTPRRAAAAAPRPATPPPSPTVQRPAPVQSATPRPVSQYQPPARPYPVSQEASAAQPRAVPPPPSSGGPTVVYSQQPTSPPPSYSQPRTYYADPSGYADSSPAPRPPASVGGGY